jgi:hypothetical protein
MTEKTVRSHSVLRRTMLVGTAGVLGGALLRPPPVRSQTTAAAAVAVPGSSPPRIVNLSDRGMLVVSVAR